MAAETGVQPGDHAAYGDDSDEDDIDAQIQAMLREQGLQYDSSESSDDDEEDEVYSDEEEPEPEKEPEVVPEPEEEEAEDDAPAGDAMAAAFAKIGKPKVKPTPELEPAQRQLRLSKAKAMGLISKADPEHLGLVLGMLLKHLNSEDLNDDEIDDLEDACEACGIEEAMLPSVCQHLKRVVDDAARLTIATQEPVNCGFKSIFEADGMDFFSEASQDSIVKTTAEWHAKLVEGAKSAKLIQDELEKQDLKFSGYLQKRGEVNTKFKRRWFELKGGTIEYYTSPGGKKRGQFHYGGGEVAIEHTGVNQGSAGRAAKGGLDPLAGSPDPLRESLYNIFEGIAI
jgi:hypothetical protein